jgi:hypothetical protein
LVHGETAFRTLVQGETDFRTLVHGETAFRTLVHGETAFRTLVHGETVFRTLVHVHGETVFRTLVHVHGETAFRTPLNKRIMSIKSAFKGSAAHRMPRKIPTRNLVLAVMRPKPFQIPDPPEKIAEIVLKPTPETIDRTLKPGPVVSKSSLVIPKIETPSSSMLVNTWSLPGLTDPKRFGPAGEVGKALRKNARKFHDDHSGVGARKKNL